MGTATSNHLRGIGPTRRTSLRARAVLAFALTSLLLSASLATSAFLVVRASLVAEREEAATRQAFTNARVVRARLRAEQPDIQDLLASLETGPDGEALLRTAGGWFASSVSADRSVLPEDLRARVESGTAVQQRVDGAENATVHVVGVPIAESAATYYQLVGLDDVDDTLGVLASSLGAGAVLATVIGGIVGAVVTGRILRPLRETAGVATAVADGQLEARLDAHGDRDIEPFAASFNTMVDRLDERARREAQFASDVSHELRGPLMSLSAAVDVVARREAQLPDDVRPAVGDLESQVTSFNQLVVDLLEISRFEAGTAVLDPRRVEIDRLVRALVDERGGRQPEVVVDRPRPPLVPVDVRRMHQVLSNLLDNADRYAGGVRRIVVSTDAAEGVVRVHLDDDGPGVPEEHRTRILERFDRGPLSGRPDAPSGTGLGLALAREHLRLHGGDLLVGDAPSGGARFTVVLPVGGP